MGFDFVTQSDGDELVFRLAGELDLAGRDTLTDAVVAALTAGRCVVADLADLVFIDSSGLSALLRCRHHARDQGGSFVIRDATGPVAHVLELTGIGKALSKPDDTASGNLQT
jgi:anti-sigma B factor antagonist